MVWQFLLNLRVNIVLTSMTGGQILRFVCIALLWLLLCYLMIVGRGFSAYSFFVIIASGIVVFVPLYKKYIKNGGKSK